MNDPLFIAILASHVVILALSVFSLWQFKRFLRRTPTITNEADLASYKWLAKSQMWISLLGFGVMALPWILWVVGHFVFTTLSWFDLFAYVAVPWIANALIIVALAPPAKAVKEIKAANAHLQSQVEHIVNTWRNKLFPDW
ncbi:MAG: hypothetical protein WEB58_07935 [Planctomycetaceae bacterium]